MNFDGVLEPSIIIGCITGAVATAAAAAVEDNFPKTMHQSKVIFNVSSDRHVGVMSQDECVCGISLSKHTRWMHIIFGVRL